MKSPRRLAVLVLAGAGGGLLGYFGARFGASLLVPVDGPKWLKLLVLPTLVPAWLVAVGVHEFGHLLGGWVTGGRFLLWVVGPFKVQRTPAGLQAGWNRSVNLAGGMAACLPLDPRAVTPGRTAVMILGGPLASLVLALAGFGLALGWAGWRNAASPALALTQHALVVGAGLSLLIALVTLFPGTAGGFKSDGRRVFDLLRGGARARQDQAVLVLSLASMAGQRPASFDQALVDDALSLRDGSLFDLYAHLMVYYRAADRREWVQAQRHLDAMLAGEERLAPFVRATVRAEYAWLLAVAASEAAVARAWLESVGPLDFDPATRLRAEAAVLLAEGQRAAAAAKAEAGLLALRERSLSPVVSPFALEALQAIRRAAG